MTILIKYNEPLSQVRVISFSWGWKLATIIIMSFVFIMWLEAQKVDEVPILIVVFSVGFVSMLWRKSTLIDVEDNMVWQGTGIFGPNVLALRINDYYLDDFNVVYVKKSVYVGHDSTSTDYVISLRGDSISLELGMISCSFCFLSEKGVAKKHGKELAKFLDMEFRVVR